MSGDISYEHQPGRARRPASERAGNESVGPEEVIFVESGPRRSRASWWLLLLLLLLLIWLLARCGRPAAAAGLPMPLGTRTSDRVDLCLIIDDSGSEQQTDPGGIRYRSASAVLDLLGDLQRKGEFDRVCVVHFGTETVPGPLRQVDHSAALGADLVPMDLGQTNIAPAIDAAREQLGVAEPGVRKSILLFTDGQPSDPDDLKKTLDVRSGVRVHLVAFDASGSFDGDARDFWESTGISSIRDVSSVDEQVIAEAFARDLVDELGMHWGSR